MNKNYNTLLAGILQFWSANLPAQIQKKEQDFDILYEESGVLSYDLPRILESEEGGVISSPEAWMQSRRPQILALFSNLIYGRVPVPENAVQHRYAEVSSDPEFLGGKAVRKVVKIELSNKRGMAEMNVLLIFPKENAKPVPALMQLSFDRIDSEKIQLDAENPEILRNKVPIASIINMGYAYVAVYQQAPLHLAELTEILNVRYPPKAEVCLKEH